MIPKHISIEVERIEKHIKIKKERIDKLKRMAKLSKNSDLISEYDLIIKNADDTINSILESKEIMPAEREQVILHSLAKSRLMAKGLKNSLCDSDKQIEMLNNAIEDDNIKIQDLQNSGKTRGRDIV